MLRLKQSFSGILWILGLLAGHRILASNDPEVLLNGTRIIGQYVQVPRKNEMVSVFWGIPYAEPPVGQLRFQKTVPLKTLPPLIHATSIPPECFSTYYPDSYQKEDCLYLNVWVPTAQPPTYTASTATSTANTASTAATSTASTTTATTISTTTPWSVMVWIHGGGFITGSSSRHEGTVLAAEHGVIVVSISYRLGAFGFLSTESDDSRGNYGLWDQHTALQWVKNNIAAFGGNPDSITIFGESAGGKSVSFQVVSPHSGGLFQRAIMQSGTVLCPTALQWKPLQTAVRLAKAVGCPSDSRHELVRCLRQRPAFQIASASGRLWDEDVVRKMIDFGWAPVQDRDFVPLLYQEDPTPTSTNTTLLPLVTPSRLSPAFSGSLMAGVNNNEGSRLDRRIERKLHDVRFFSDTYLPEVLAQMFKTLPENSTSFRTASSRASCFYCRNRNGNSQTITARELYDQYGDQAYVAPTFHFLEQWLNSSDSPVYAYVFDNYPGAPDNQWTEGMEGMGHGDDLSYTFGTIEEVLEGQRASWETVRREGKLGRNFRRLLTNFAKSGNPAGPIPLDSEWPKWPLFDLRQQRYLSVSSTPTVSDHYRVKYMTLWNHLVPSLVTGKTGSDSSASNACADDDLIG